MVLEKEKPVKPLSDADKGLENKQSYRDMLLNRNIAEEEEVILESMHEIAEENWIKDAMEAQGEGEGILFDPCPTIEISLEEAEEWCRPWKQALIVRLLGKRITLRMLQNQLERKWTKTGPIKVIDISEEYFLVHFNQEEDYKFALFEGPWMIQDHYIVVQRWVLRLALC